MKSGLSAAHAKLHTDAALLSENQRTPRFHSKLLAAVSVEHRSQHCRE